MSNEDIIRVFFQKLRPLQDEENEYYDNLPIGSEVWFPCAGITSMGIKSGHVGQINTYTGHKKWKLGDWVDEQTAMSRGITISDTHTHCNSCSKIFNEHNI